MGRLIRQNFGGKKRPSNYPENWDEISENFRKKHDYKCAICDVDCSKHTAILDVHHKNGVRSDCREGNLLCLCKFHHSKQPYHNHYKPKHDDMELLRKLWEKQKIPMENREGNQ